MAEPWGVPSDLRVVALISGGKDSLFSILHCLSNGHKVVALANLKPKDNSTQRQIDLAPEVEALLDGLGPPTADEGTLLNVNPENMRIMEEDINSYMYQTVGASCIHLYRQALGIPLYRNFIQGSARVIATNYYSVDIESRADFDETESMYILLDTVKRVHPEINAVCSGAILSNYQRTRVESVAVRLGLTPLSYLWQFPYLPPHQHESLLNDMAASGQDSRIIKVASGGLNAAHLGLNVADPTNIAILKRDMSKYGGSTEIGSLLGEGGEYETLTIDGPRPLWTSKLNIEAQIVAGSSGSSSLKVNGSLLPKEAPEEKGVRIPDFLDKDFWLLLYTLNPFFPVPPPLDDGSVDETGYVSVAEAAFNKLSLIIPEVTNTWPVAKSFPRVHGNNCIMIGNPFVNVETILGSSAGEQALAQLNDISLSIQEYWPQLGDPFPAVSFVMVLLRDMNDFAEVNRAYEQIFIPPNPPARVTVAIGKMLPGRSKVSFAMVVDYLKGHGRREALHVQSRSYWAPANIGPYSQAVSVLNYGNPVEDPEKITKLVYVAGQIPLVPKNMELCDVAPVDSTLFVTQTVLALQHLWRIGRAMRVDWWLNGVAFITANYPNQARLRALAAAKAWEQRHKQERNEGGSLEGAEDEEEEDIADAALYSPWARNREYAEAKDTRPPLPNYARVGYQNHATLDKRPIPPCFVVQVVDLPRKAPIEWMATGIQGPVFIEERSQLRDVCHLDGNDKLSFHSACVEDTEMLVAFVKQVGMEGRASMEKYHSHFYSVYTASPNKIPDKLIHKMNIHVIPCLSVWNSKGEKVFAGVTCRAWDMYQEPISHRTD